MQTFTTYLLFTAVAIMGGCRSGGGEATPNPSDKTSHRRGIGEACRKDSDCVVGAACSYATCDFKDPCSVTSTGPSGVTTFAYAYDADGRAMGRTDTRDGKVVWRDVATWSDDGRVVSWKSWDSDDAEKAPIRTSTTSFDAAGDMTRSIDTYSDGLRDETTYTWAEDWACRAPSTTFDNGERVLKTRTTCDKGGAPERIDHVDPSGAVVMSKRYTYRDGRLAERVTDYTGSVPNLGLLRLVFERDARGAVIAMEVDRGADGTVEQRDVYDLGCWAVVGDRVVYNAP